MSDVGYPATSRYAGSRAVIIEVRGEPDIVVLERRWVPMGEGLTDVGRHVVGEAERLDQIANQELGDPEQWWRVADANDALIPAELERPGLALRITLPAGIPGASDAR
jgi:hypothetical protein